MGIAYAWEKMSQALDALAVAPEALPARLKHALVPHFMNALHDAEQVEDLPAELLGAMRGVRDRVHGVEFDARSSLSQKDGEALATQIVQIAHEIRRRSTF